MRPDLYVYGGCDLENISNIIESLEDKFFLSYDLKFMKLFTLTILFSFQVKLLPMTEF